MAGKLKIKRNGGCLPTLSLLAVLLLGGVLAWLSLVGLPDSALRRLEREAAAAGVPVKVGAIKLSPGSGLALKVEDVSLAVPQADAPDATLRARKVKVRFSLMNLMAGDWIPASLYMRAAAATVPLSRNGEETLTAVSLDMQGAYNAREERLDLRASTNLQGIDLDLHAFLPEEMLTAESTQESAGPLDLPRLLAEARPKMEQAYREIGAQHWQNAPTLFLAVDCMDKGSPVVLIFANVESYEYGGYHFREISVDANYREDILVVNAMRFHTANPDAEVEFKGGYDIGHRLLDFQFKSNAALLLMLRDVLGEDAPAALRAFSHGQDTTPHIELEGQAEFTDDFAINSISTRGSLEIGECAFNDSTINRAFLSFFYDNGNFNLSELSVDFPDGGLRASGSITQELGNARVDITMPEPSLEKLLGNLYGKPVSLSEDIKAEGVIHLAAETDMSTKPFIPGKTRLEEMVPTLHNVKLLLEPERLAYAGTALTRPSLQLSVGGTNLAMERPEALEAQSVTVDFSAEAVEHALGEGNTLKVFKPAMHADFSGVRVMPDNLAESSADHLKAHLRADSASTRHGTVNGVSLNADVPDLASNWQRCVTGGTVALEVREIQAAEGFTATNLNLAAGVADDKKGAATVSLDTGDRHFSTSMGILQETEDTVLLTVEDADIPLAALQPLLFPDGPPTEDFLLPEKVLLNGRARYNLDKETLYAGTADLHVPQLVRTPHKVAALRGKNTPLDVTLHADWNTNAEGHTTYTADTVIADSTGKLDLKLDGVLDSRIHITGTSSILVSSFDNLLDDEDAHRIMADFRTRGNTYTRAENIDALVDYSNGVRVSCHCEGDVGNLEYMTGILQLETAEDGTLTGKEEVRTDLPDKDPISTFKHGSCKVDVDLLLDAVDAAGEPVPNRQIVNLSDITLEYDNRPWQKRRGFTGGPASSTFTCSSIIFDLEINRMDLENGSGCVYPAYAFGTFFPPLQDFMKDIITPEPVQVESKHCVFPIAKRTQAPILGTIRVTTNKPCAYHFLGTDLPVERFSCFVDLTDDFVTIDRLNGKSFDGALNGTVKIGISGKHTSVDGYVALDCADLQKIGKVYDIELNNGNCCGNIRFQAPSTELKALQAYGEASIKDADLMQLSIFSPISDFISDIPGHIFKMKDSVTGQKTPDEPGVLRRAATAVFSSPKKIIKGIGNTAQKVPFVNHFIAYDIQDAYLSYTIKDGHMRSRTMKAMGANLTVRANVDLDLDTLAITGDMWPDLSSVPALVLRPLTFLSRFIVDIHLGGTLKDLQWNFGLKERKKNGETGQTPQAQTKP